MDSGIFMQRNYRKWRPIQTLAELIYPPRCLGCGSLVTSDFGLCGPCWSETAFIGGAVCESCGTPLPGHVRDQSVECDDCMNSPRPWQAGRAALLYQARARKLILALKHGARPELAKPAARWMAIAGHELFSAGHAVCARAVALVALGQEALQSICTACPVYK